MRQYYDSRIGDFQKDMRVELHPATDLWMAGARYGTVMAVGITKVHVQLDMARGIHRLPPELLRPVDGHVPAAPADRAPTIEERLTTVGRGYTTAGQVIEELKRCELFESYADAGATVLGTGDAATFRCDVDDDGYEFVVTVIRVQKEHPGQS